MYDGVVYYSVLDNIDICVVWYFMCEDVEFIYGVMVNNNLMVFDVWNSMLVFGYFYVVFSIGVFLLVGIFVDGVLV